MKLTVLNDDEFYLEHDQIIPISQDDYNKLLQMNESQVKHYLYSEILPKIKKREYKNILETWLKDKNICWKLS